MAEHTQTGSFMLACSAKASFISFNASSYYSICSSVKNSYIRENSYMRKFIFESIHTYERCCLTDETSVRLMYLRSKEDAKQFYDSFKGNLVVWKPLISFLSTWIFWSSNHWCKASNQARDSRPVMSDLNHPREKTCKKKHLLALLVTPFSEVGRKNIKYVLSVSCYWGSEQRTVLDTDTYNKTKWADSPAKMLAS